MVAALVQPSQDLLPGYLDALGRNWTPDSDSDGEAAQLLKASVADDPQSFLRSLSNESAEGAPIVLTDGSRVARLPWTRFWISDGEYAGELNFRWQPGTSELPPYCLGHVGYAVVPWKRGKRYAAICLRQLIPIAACKGLAYVDICMDERNMASRRTAELAGARFVEVFDSGAEFNNVQAVRYQLAVSGDA